MRFVEEYRDPTTARALVARITELAAPTTISSSWRCAGATRTPSTGTESSTCCPGAWNWSTGRVARFVASHYAKPLVTAGFEPLDILQAIAMLLTQIRE